MNDQIHNGRQPVIVEVEEQAQRLTNEEQNMDIMMERVEAIMMHMEQSLQA